MSIWIVVVIMLRSLFLLHLGYTTLMLLFMDDLQLSFNMFTKMIVCELDNNYMYLMCCKGIYGIFQNLLLSGNESNW